MARLLAGGLARVRVVDHGTGVSRRHSHHDSPKPSNTKSGLWPALLRLNGGIGPDAALAWTVPRLGRRN